MKNDIKFNHRKKSNRWVTSDEFSGYCFILPALIFLLGIVVFPLLYNIIISFQEVNVQTLNTTKPFIGINNYKSVLAMPVFGKAFFNTFYFTVVCIIFQFTIGFALALLFAKKFFLNQFSRGILLVCWLIPTIVASSVWKWIFAGDYSGVLNYILMQIGILNEPVSWMTSGSGAMGALIVTTIWRGVPFNMLLLATALTTLPEDIYEAAWIDGASKFKSFINITIPLLRPAIISVITLGFIYTFKTFELIYIMTGGGPVDATENLATISYRLTFANFEFGQGAAVANIMFSILIVIGIINLRFIQKDEVMS